MSNPCECCQTKLRFIRLINGNFMHSMVIPEWFVKYFGGKIPGTVKLEAANGNIYDVGVTESMNRKILQSGWAAFVDANKIEENHSLMFRYLGNSRFKVTIFDSNEENPSADDSLELDDLQMLSKDYVLSGRCDLTVEQEGKIHALIVEIQPEIPMLVVLMKKTNVEPCNVLVIHKDYALACFPRESQTITLQVARKSKDWPCNLRIRRDGGCNLGEDHGSSDNSKGASKPPFMLPDRTLLTQAQEKKVLEKVSAIESELPIYVAVMNKTSVCRRYRGPYLSFAVRYVSRYLEKKYAAGHRAKSVISLVLQREGKSRTWDTELRYSSDRTVISKGWASFARINSLREDDLCLFKVMENEEPLKMMVYIIRREKCLA
ncbi:hypothetical protein ACQ4PT_057794 [Festuca glaucescens]